LVEQPRSGIRPIGTRSEKRGAAHTYAGLLHFAGRFDQGLACIDEAVRIYQDLAEADPTRFLPDLAISLNSQAELLRSAGRPTDGLAPITQAVRIYQALAPADPTRFLPDLATSLNNQSTLQAEAGRPIDGL
jgi:tetratricopeptide (TPR) repeat protein